MAREAVADLIDYELLMKIENAFSAGDYDRVISFKPGNPADITPDMAERLFSAHLYKGNSFLERALAAGGGTADGLFEEAYGHYESALELRPGDDEVLNNWGGALAEQGKSKAESSTNAAGDAAADALFRMAYKKFGEAIAAKPDCDEVFYNWGCALADHAGTKAGNEAGALLMEACGKYEAALAIKPDRGDALNNWGSALSGLGKAGSGAVADSFFRRAYAKFEAALEIAPGDDDTLNNWGVALSRQARMKQGEAADELFTKSYEKYAEALRTKPDKHEAFYNWGNALFSQANTKAGDGADWFFRGSYKKYSSALKIRPGLRDALYNWGCALSDQANSKTGEAADVLYEKAYEKFGEALKVRPADHEALNNWGNALTRHALMKPGAEADELFETAYKKYLAAVKIRPDRHAVLYNWGSALFMQAKSKAGDETAAGIFRDSCKIYETAYKLEFGPAGLFNMARALSEQALSEPGVVADWLYEEAHRNYAAAVEANPENYMIYKYWGLSLRYQAEGKSGAEADELLRLSNEKREASERLKPDSYEEKKRL